MSMTVILLFVKLCETAV